MEVISKFYAFFKKKVSMIGNGAVGAGILIIVANFLSANVNAGNNQKATTSEFFFRDLR